MTLNPWRRARRSTARPMWRSGSPARAAASASRLASLVASSRRRADGADPPDRRAGAGVGPVAVELGRHVDVDEVAIGEDAVRRRDPVRRLVVHAHARRRREADGRRRRAGPVAVEHLAPDGVELGRRHARLGGGEHGVAGLGHRPPGELQAGEVLILIDRHAPSVRGRSSLCVTAACSGRCCVSVVEELLKVGGAWSGDGSGRRAGRGRAGAGRQAAGALAGGRHWPSWMRWWCLEQSGIKFSRLVAPPSFHSLRWWMSQSPKRTGQSGAAQVRCMARSARRWSAVARRLARPTSTTLPSPSNTIGMMSASHASRRTVRVGGAGRRTSRRCWTREARCGRSRGR